MVYVFYAPPAYGLHRNIPRRPGTPCHAVAYYHNKRVHSTYRVASIYSICWGDNAYHGVGVTYRHAASP